MSADARRAELLQAALRVMSRDGVAAGTTRAIVAEAGMPLATFHYCFRSRNELLRELITLVTSMERDAAAAAMATGEPVPAPARSASATTAATSAAGTMTAGTMTAGTMTAGTTAAGTTAVGTTAVGTTAAGTMTAGTTATGITAVGTDTRLRTTPLATAAFRDILRQGLRGYIGLLTENPGHELFLFELNHYALRTPELQDLAVEQYRRYYDTATQLLVAAAEVAEMRWTVDLPLLARLVVTLTDGATTTWLADRDTAATLAALDLAADYVAGLAVPLEPAPTPGAGPSTRSR